MSEQGDPQWIGRVRPLYRGCAVEHPLVRPLKAALPHVAVDMLVFKANVILLQGEGDCVPCLHEGCDRHIHSLSDCLQNLHVSRVIQAAEMMLAEGEGRVQTTGIPIARAGSVAFEDRVG